MKARIIGRKSMLVYTLPVSGLCILLSLSPKSDKWTGVVIMLFLWILTGFTYYKYFVIKNDIITIRTLLNPFSRIKLRIDNIDKIAFAENSSMGTTIMEIDLLDAKKVYIVLFICRSDRNILDSILKDSGVNFTG